MGALYALEFPNAKRYIGITHLSAQERFRQHIKNLADKERAGLAVYRALRKYGHENVSVNILAQSDNWQYLVAAEQSAIAMFGTNTQLHGYNLTRGGEGAPGIKISSAARQRMSAARKKTWDDPVYKARMCASRLGKKQSSIARAKRAESIRKAWTMPGYRERLSEAHKKRWATRKINSEQS